MKNKYSDSSMELPCLFRKLWQNNQPTDVKKGRLQLSKIRKNKLMRWGSWSNIWRILCKAQWGVGEAKDGEEEKKGGGGSNYLKQRTQLRTLSSLRLGYLLIPKETWRRSLGVYLSTSSHLLYVHTGHTFKKSSILAFKMPATWPKWLRKS